MLDVKKYTDSYCSMSAFYNEFRFVENADRSVSMYCESLLLLKVTPLKSKLNIQFKYAVDLSDIAEVDISSEDGKATKCSINDIKALYEIIPRYFKNVDNYIMSTYTPETFGCCSRYTECSDQLECIHPDKLHSKGCMYRQNLEAGRIFYGKNKNI